MLSSGVTALDTSDDTAITLLANSGGLICREVNIINKGIVEGFVSLDGGVTWLYMPPGAAGAPSSRTFDIRHRPFAVVVKAKRVAGGANLDDLFADAY